MAELLQWSGGLNSAVDPGLIGPTEIQDGTNFLCRDGNARLDRRYIQAYNHAGAAATTMQGSGHGKFGTGTLADQYVAVRSGTLYEYDLGPDTIAAVVAATGLALGDWFWQQFENHLYGVNDLAGIGRKLLAPGNNGHGDWETLRLPDAPGSAPTSSQGGLGGNGTFTGGTLSASGTPTSALIQADGKIAVTWNSSGAGPQTISITFKTSAPDNRMDLQYHDVIYQLVEYTTGLGSNIEVDVYSTQLAAESRRAVRWFYPTSSTSAGNTLAFRVSNIARENRIQVTKLVYNVNVPSNGGTIKLSRISIAGVLLSLNSQSSIPDNTDPVFQPLKYEYTRYDSVTGFESAPSPTHTIPASQQYHFGEWRNVVVTTGGAADKNRVYRRVDANGLTIRYRLGETPNTGGTQTFVDKFALEEVEALPIYSPSIIPPSGITAITAWLNRLVIAQGSLVLISRDDNPLAFADQTTNFDPNDEARAESFYADDKRAETVLGFASQDTLYIVTDQSVRYLFGTTPDNWRLGRIADAEGAVGPRAIYPYQGGVLVFTPSGRLLFCTLGAKPVEVSEKVRAKVGNLGIKALAWPDTTVTVWPDGEVEVRAATGDYYILDTDGNWRKGTHTHPTHSTLPVSGSPRRWFGSNGYLYQGNEDSYVTDGGLDGEEGVPVFFRVVTRERRSARQTLTKMYVRCPAHTFQETETGQTVLYPRITPLTRMNEATAIPLKPGLGVNLPTKRNIPVPPGVTGEEIYFVLEGDKDTVYQELRATFEDAGEGSHL